MSGRDEREDVTLTKEELRALVRDTVHQTLLTMGMDVKEPLEMQRDFQYVRALREASGSFKTKLTITATLALVTGLLQLLWVGVREYLKSTN